MKYPSFSPYIIVDDAVAAIEFYKTAFSAKERFRLVDPGNGSIGHAELEIEDGMLMLSEANPSWGSRSPKSFGGTSCKLCLIVKNADETFQRAVAAGATVRMEPTDMFYGFRSGSLVDPFGHEWLVQHLLRELSPDDMQREWDTMLKGSA